MGLNEANEGYRSFARGGIAAVIAINSLALVSALSQITELQAAGDVREMMLAFMSWTFGVVSGVLAWLFGALAAHAFAHQHIRRELWMAGIGYIAFLASLSLFAYGAWRMAIGVLAIGSA